MKSAEHWANETGDVTAKNGAMIYTCAEVKQIQLDAMREGMKKASAEIQNHFSAHDMTALIIEKAVLSAAKQLTEKDL